VRALVTGGSSGIGRATALALARAGADVAILARGEERLKDTLEALQEAAPHQRFFQACCDVADSTQTQPIVDRVLDALGGVDLLVNNAGAAVAARIGDTPPEAYQALMEINYHAVVRFTRALLPDMLARGSGHVVNISSMAGLVGIYGYTAYAASKFAVSGFSEALRQELAPQGIRVSVVYPPDTDTPQLAFENRTKPAATRAVAGNIAPLSADQVAESLLCGVARGRFRIIPGRTAKLLAFAIRHFPALARRVMDRDVARAGSG